MSHNRIVLASGNKGKLKEIQSLFNEASLDYELIPQSELNVEEVPETGLSFVENALIKARNAAKQTGLPALADDSGIAVDALEGAPGIYSARYAGEHASDEDNLLKLIDAIKNVPEEKRSAQFVCVMVFVRTADDPVPLIAEGLWRGFVSTETSGTNGFGYDPMFYVPEHNCMSAELSSEIKNKISHRGLALQQLMQKLQNF